MSFFFVHTGSNFIFHLLLLHNIICNRVDIQHLRRWSNKSEVGWLRTEAVHLDPGICLLPLWFLILLFFLFLHFIFKSKWEPWNRRSTRSSADQRVNVSTTPVFLCCSCSVFWIDPEQIQNKSFSFSQVLFIARFVATQISFINQTFCHIFCLFFLYSVHSFRLLLSLESLIWTME